jgi:hypothetical protein
MTSEDNTTQYATSIDFESITNASARCRVNPRVQQAQLGRLPNRLGP